MAFFQQAKWKETSTHTYLKRDSDKFFFGGALFAFGLGTIMTAKGYSDMMLNVNKKPATA